MLTERLLGVIPDQFRPYLAGIGIPLASLESGCWLPEIRPENEVARLRGPVLIFHAEEDPLIPADHAARLYEHAVQPKTLWLARTRGDGSALFQAEAQYLQTIGRWYKFHCLTKAAVVAHSAKLDLLPGYAQRPGHDRDRDEHKP